jgi:Holliday junction resolvase RusA-like endonuclease
MFLNKRGKGRILSTFYRAWKTEAGWKLKQYKIQPIKGPFKLKILLDDTRSGDCDNRIKAVCDLLVSCGIIEGDQKKYMRGVSVEWAKVTDCVVTICSLP